jgi:hypothetical protein
MINIPQKSPNMTLNEVIILEKLRNAPANEHVRLGYFLLNTELSRQDIIKAISSLKSRKLIQQKGDYYELYL